MQRPRYSELDEREYLARGYWRDDDTLWHWLRRHAAERPEAPAVVSPAGLLTWRALHDRVLRVARGLKDKGIDAGEVVAVQLPNTLEFLLVHLAAARLGAGTVLLPAYKPDELAQTVERERPTALWAGPAHVAACRNAGLFDKYDWSSLELAIVSGSIAPPPLVRYFAEKLPRCAVTPLWGMTELQAGLYTRPGDPLELSATTAGRPSPGTELRLAADGELQVRGPLAFSGYYRNDDATRAAFTDDGWFRTGDLAEERNGHYAITGRSKDIINRGGVKFNPADVEALLDAHPQIQQSAIVPMPDPVLGEKACAFVTLREGCDAPTLDDLVSYLLGKDIAKNKLPERLVVIPEMPLTPTRKIMKGR